MEGEICPACGKATLIRNCSRTYKGIIQQYGGGYARAASFKEGPAQCEYEVAVWNECPECGFRNSIAYFTEYEDAE